MTNTINMVGNTGVSASQIEKVLLPAWIAESVIERLGLFYAGSNNGFYRFATPSLSIGSTVYSRVSKADDVKLCVNTVNIDLFSESKKTYDMTDYMTADGSLSEAFIASIQTNGSMEAQNREAVYLDLLSKNLKVLYDIAGSKASNFVKVSADDIAKYDEKVFRALGKLIKSLVVKRVKGLVVEGSKSENIICLVSINIMENLRNYFAGNGFNIDQFSIGLEKSIIIHGVKIEVSKKLGQSIPVGELNEKALDLSKIEAIAFDRHTVNAVRNAQLYSINKNPDGHDFNHILTVNYGIKINPLLNGFHTAIVNADL